MTGPIEPIERFTVESLLLPDVGARVMRPRLQCVELHWHDYYELSLITSGRAEHVVNGESRTVATGSAFLLSPADLHAIRAVGEEPLGCYNAIIDSEVMERQLAAVGPPALDGFPWHVDGFLEAEPDFRRLQTELEQPRLGSMRVVDAMVGCLVVELARRTSEHCPSGSAASALPPTLEEQLRGAVLYVDRHFRQPISLADAAARAHLSPNYFSERFHQVTGTSFQLYLQERRLRFARSLLASTGLSVTEVCHAAGFSNLSHFGRAFRSRYGTSPSAGRGLPSGWSEHLGTECNDT